MELYFLRHGEAEPAAPGGTDDARQLTDRGRQETLVVAQALHRAGVRPEVILTSPFLRARQTGEALEEVFGVSARVEERLRSGCTLGDIQDVLADRPEARFVLVGHEPDVSRMVGRLIGDARVKMQTSCLARVEAEQVEPGGGTLIWLLSPQVAGAG
jgi:phosphohistidine phosphatase